MSVHYFLHKLPGLREHRKDAENVLRNSITARKKYQYINGQLSAAFRKRYEKSA